MTHNTQSEFAFLTSLFDAAIAAADPDAALKPYLPEPPKGRTVVIGAGKGSAQLAAAFERLWSNASCGPLTGVVVTRYGYAEPCQSIDVLEAAHPVPDEAGLGASDALLDAVSDLTEDDLVVALICGGGSSLLPAPPHGVALEDEQAMNAALLASGAPISQMNAIRKHVSRLKGGRLAQAAHPARVVSLVVSDVPGDDPAQVASGPTVPDDVTRHEALELIKRLNLKLPQSIMTHFQTPEAEAPLPTDAVFASHETHVISSASLSLNAARHAAEEQGVPAVILSDQIEGEARDVAQVHAAIAKEVLTNNQPFTKPVVILSGGETTVTLNPKNHGRGGRNTEFLLSLAQALDGCSSIYALAADTDGIDGSEDNAGAFVDGGSWTRMRAHGRDPALDLVQNDAFSAFEAVGDLFSPGPTGTNVNDFRAILIR